MALGSCLQPVGRETIYLNLRAFQSGSDCGWLVVEPDVVIVIWHHLLFATVA